MLWATDAEIQWYINRQTATFSRVDWAVHYCVVFLLLCVFAAIISALIWLVYIIS